MITQEEIEIFLHGSDPEEHIVSIEYDYVKDTIYKIKEIPGKGKSIQREDFIPFAWVGNLQGMNFYSGSKSQQKEAMSKHKIVIERLRTTNEDGSVNERLENGLKFLVKSLSGYRSLVQFFREGGLDPWAEKTRDYILILPPVEQFLVSKEKRLFKGFEEYNDITRLVFDLETTSLEPKDGRIFMIGVKTNKGHKKVIECSDEESEREGIIEFFNIIDEIKPSIIAGYNSFNFDWVWLKERCKALRIDFKKTCKTLNPLNPVSTKESLLKIAAETERFEQINMWGYNVIDIIHSVRRTQAINSNIKSAGLKYITQFIKAESKDRVYIDHLNIGPFYAKKEEYWLNITNGNYRKVGVDPKIDEICGRNTEIYIKTTGDDLVERYLDDDLEETLSVDEEFNQGSFLLASMIPTTYERVSTMGTATLWKMIMTAWSYKNNLAIPKKEQKTDFVGGLSRLLKVGYSRNVLKLDYSSLYPSVQLVHDIFPDCDVTHAMKGFLTYFRNKRLLYKDLSSEWDLKDAKKSQSYDRKQLPIKVFINSMFGSLSAPHVYPWGDMRCGEQVTCTGRQYLRQMIKFFMKKGYVPLVMDTDGVNFSKPDGWENHRYIGKGLNWKVEKDKEYIGDDADVAEFNDTFMKGEMALDTDGTWTSCINLSRKNYAVMESNGKIKLTGNTIKSKKLPIYIEEFLDKGIRLLLQGEGHRFVEYYYEYLDMIYRKDIPLMKIAQRARVKLSIEDYIKRSTQKTKSGGAMSRMAHMELVIRDKIQVSLGDEIYYVNNGEKPSHGDVQKVNKPKKGWSDKQLEMYFSSYNETHYKEKFLLKNGWEKSWSDDNWVKSDSPNREGNTGIPTDVAYRLVNADNTESVIQLNCYRIDPKDLENNPDLKGDFNVQRVITTFNKRIEPLLVCFGQEIRDGLIVNKPEDRNFFTKTQCTLINGLPMDSGDQDDLILDVMNMSEDESKFWKNSGINPDYIYELAEQGWEEYV